MTAESAIKLCNELAAKEREMGYSERLFKIKQLEYKRDAIRIREADWGNPPVDLEAHFTKNENDRKVINTQISKLLEDK